MDGLRSIVTDDMNDFMDLELTTEEIHIATFQMHPTKALGIDGFHALFYQKFWDIIGDDVVCLVRRWWRELFDMKRINQTNVCLISKRNEPKSIKYFRPISCCNVIYKIISKTLANRLKPFLDHIISVNQSAFISGRLILIMLC